MRAAAACVALLLAAPEARAQATRDVGLPPPFDVPALPPAVNPALPPPTGQRYLPGTGGPFADPDKPALRSPPPRARSAAMEGYSANIRASLKADRPGRIARLADVASYLRACWRPPAGFAPSARLDATLRFSLTKEGALVGEPRVAYVNARASAAQRNALVESVGAAVKSCAPLPLSQRFGAAVAGRPIAIRFIVDAGAD